MNDRSSHAAGGSVSETCPAWSMRAWHSEDEAFLNELYIQTRLEEVSGWGFPPELARSFLLAQAMVQRRAYALQFPDATTSILQERERPVGRLIVASDHQALRVVDVSIVTARRGRGLGAWALGHVIESAAARGVPVRLTVAGNGRARALYQRLGFRPLGIPRQDGSVAMEWRAA